MTNEERVEELSTFIWGLRKGQKNEFKNDMLYNISEHLEELNSVEKFWEEVESKELRDWYIYGDENIDNINEAFEYYGKDINDILINEYMRPRGLTQLVEIDDFNKNDLIVSSYHNKQVIMCKVIDIIIEELTMKIKGEN